MAGKITRQIVSSALLALLPLCSMGEISWIGGKGSEWSNVDNWGGTGAGDLYFTTSAEEMEMSFVEDMSMFTYIDSGYKPLFFVGGTPERPFVLNGCSHMYDNSAGNNAQRRIVVAKGNDDGALRFFNGCLKTYYLDVGAPSAFGWIQIDGAGGVDTAVASYNTSLYNGGLVLCDASLEAQHGFYISYLSGCNAVVSNMNSSISTTRFLLGYGPDSTSCYYQHGGSLRSDQWLCVGMSADNTRGNSLFELDGGLVEIASRSYGVLVGDNGGLGARARMIIRGGRVYCSGIFSVGRNAAATVDVYGGEVVVERQLNFAELADNVAGEDCILNLNGGVIETPMVKYGLGAGNAEFRLNGGTLKAMSDGTLIAGHDRLKVSVGADGGIVDVAGHHVTIEEDIGSAFADDPAPVKDGGMEFCGGGVVELTGAVGYTGETVVEEGTAVKLDSIEQFKSILHHGLRIKLSAHQHVADVSLVLELCDAEPILNEQLEYDSCSFLDPSVASSLGAQIKVSGDGKRVCVLYPRSEAGVSFWTGLGDGISLADPRNWQGDSVPLGGDVLDFSSIVGDVAVNGNFDDGRVFCTLSKTNGLVKLSGTLSVVSLTNAEFLAIQEDGVVLV